MMRRFIAVFILLMFAQLFVVAPKVEAVRGLTGSKPSIGLDPATYGPGSNTISYLVSKDGYSDIDTTNIRIYSKSSDITVFVAGADLCGYSHTLYQTRDKIFDKDLQNGAGNQSKNITDFSLKAVTAKASAVGVVRSEAACTNYDTEQASGVKEWPTIKGEFYSSMTRMMTLKINPGDLDSARQAGTDYYVYEFKATITKSGSACVAVTRCFSNQFRIKVFNGGQTGSQNYDDDSNIVISQNPDLNFREFGIQPGVVENSGESAIPSRLATYFASSCSVNQVEQKVITIFDDDNYIKNDPPAKDQPTNAQSTGPFLMRLERTDRENPDWSNAEAAIKPANYDAQKNISGSSNIALAKKEWVKSGGNDWLYVASNHDDNQNTITMKISMDPTYAYRLTLKDIDTGVIQLGVPYPSFWADITCWNLRPTTTVDNTELVPSQKATFTHKVYNKSDSYSPVQGGANKVAYEVFQRIDKLNSDGSLKTTGPETSQLTGYLPRVSPRSGYVIQDDPKLSYTANANNTDAYRRVCQWLKINPGSFLKDAGEKKSDEQCTVIKSVAVLGTVNVTPIIKITPSGSGIETGTNYTVESYVEVKGMPTQTRGGQTYATGGTNDPAGAPTNCQIGTSAVDPSDNNRRCFVRAAFPLTCNRGGQFGSSSTTIGYVDADGEYCKQGPISVPAGAIGANACYNLSVGALTNATESSGGSWQERDSPTPRYRIPGYAINNNNGNRTKIQLWGFNTSPEESCATSVGYPYFKAYGGDIRAGGGFGVDGYCAAKTNATIQANNAGATEYRGAGGQYGVFASAFIDGLVSGQYNALMPKGLTFANTIQSDERYKAYGGGFTASSCTNLLDTSTTPEAGTGTYNVSEAPGLTAATAKTRYISGRDAYIASDITYNTSWTTTADIPQYRLIVVGGDIYIGSGVKQLDGVYAAIPADNGSGTEVGGNIYTCATGGASSPAAPTITYTKTCKNQLVVNGSMAGKKINLLRDCGSRMRASTAKDLTKVGAATTDGNYSNGYCAGAGGNNAAEVFNFSPEVWLPSSATGTVKGKYDFIRSLPPVL